MKEEIIKKFTAWEMENKNCSQGYIQELSEAVDLLDLIDIVASWDFRCHGKKGKAARYILDCLNRMP